jgi:hypothetical protein
VKIQIDLFDALYPLDDTENLPFVAAAGLGQIP